MILCESSTFAQSKYDFSQFGQETGDFIRQPTRWNGSDWLKVGLIGGATLLTMQVDEPIRELALKDRSYYYSVPIEAGRIYGELYSPIVLFAGFAAHSLIMHNASSRKTAYEIGQASLYTGTITLILKTAFGRSRPYMNEGVTSYHPFTFRDDYHSLSGGHAATAIVLSTILSRNAGPKWLKIVAYLPAALTPISRIYQDWHWASDNVLGGAIAFCVATWVVDLHETKDKEIQNVPSVPLINISIALN
jgi:membrane-associated phospholipid phosphatase